MVPRNNAYVTHCEKLTFYFQNKEVHVYQAEDWPADICLKMLCKNDKGKNLKFLILIFF